MCVCVRVCVCVCVRERERERVLSTISEIFESVVIQGQAGSVIVTASRDTAHIYCQCITEGH